MITKKIIVVDDERVILDVVTMLLEMRGFEVFAYDHADNLIENIKLHQPGIILLDVQVGRFDGRLLCKGIKEQEEYAHLPILLFSANAHHKKDIKNYLCDDFIEKPFKLNELLSTIEQHLQKLPDANPPL